MWRRMPRVSWTEKTTNESILIEIRDKSAAKQKMGLAT